MGKKDRILKSAFEVYQSTNEQVQQKKGREMGAALEFDYDGDFEDTVYRCIERLHIANPRVKAKRIRAGVAISLVICFMGSFLLSGQSRRAAEVTKGLENLYQEAQARYQEKGMDSYIVSEPDSPLGYEVLLLTQKQTEELESMKLPCRKTNREMTVSGGREICGTGVLYSVWNVYKLTDRKSRCYYILEDKTGQKAIAKYATMRSEEYWGEGVTAGTDGIIQDVLGIKSEKDIRSVTLERYQAKNQDNPDKLMAFYTKDGEKSTILSVLGQENPIYGTYETPDGVDMEEWQSVEGLEGKGWYEAVELTPEKCYYLSVENRYQESYLFGIVTDGENVQLYTGIALQEETSEKMVAQPVDEDWEATDAAVDNSGAEEEDTTSMITDNSKQVVLSKEEQEQISDWIAKAE